MYLECHAGPHKTQPQLCYFLSKNPFSVSVYLIYVSLLVTLMLKSVLGMVFTSFLYMGFWLQVIFSHMCKFPVDTLLYKLLLDP